MQAISYKEHCVFAYGLQAIYILYYALLNFWMNVENIHK